VYRYHFPKCSECCDGAHPFPLLQPPCTTPHATHRLLRPWRGWCCSSASWTVLLTHAQHISSDVQRAAQALVLACASSTLGCHDLVSSQPGRVGVAMRPTPARTLPPLTSPRPATTPIDKASRWRNHSLQRLRAGATPFWPHTRTRTRSRALRDPCDGPKKAPARDDSSQPRNSPQHVDGCPSATALPLSREHVRCHDVG
jgi:hypothetical protein